MTKGKALFIDLDEGKPRLLENNETITAGHSDFEKKEKETLTLVLRQKSIVKINLI